MSDQNISELFLLILAGREGPPEITVKVLRDECSKSYNHPPRRQMSAPPPPKGDDNTWIRQVILSLRAGLSPAGAVRNPVSYPLWSQGPRSGFVRCCGRTGSAGWKTRCVELLRGAGLMLEVQAGPPHPRTSLLSDYSAPEFLSCRGDSSQRNGALCLSVYSKA